LILGPILFIILVSGMAKYLGIGDGENVVYMEDSNMWQTGKDVEEVIRKLTEKAASFVDYTQSKELLMNASNMHLLLSTNAGNVANISMMVDGNTITPGNNIKLLGIKYN
jgi:hypothetical protein